MDFSLFPEYPFYNNVSLILQNTIIDEFCIPFLSNSILTLLPFQTLNPEKPFWGQKVLK